MTDHLRYSPEALQELKGQVVPAVVYDVHGTRHILGEAVLGVDDRGLTARISVDDKGVADILQEGRFSMAGSYNHIVENDGNLGDPEYVADMLETDGDVFEAVEQMYGMIWNLAQGWAGPFPSGDIHDAQLVWCARMKQVVAQATAEYKDGLATAKIVHSLSPDTWREDE